MIIMVTLLKCFKCGSSLLDSSGPLNLSSSTAIEEVNKEVMASLYNSTKCQPYLKILPEQKTIVAICVKHDFWFKHTINCEPRMWIVLGFAAKYKNLNHKSFPYILSFSDEPWKFPPQMIWRIILWYYWITLEI